MKKLFFSLLVAATATAVHAQSTDLPSTQIKNVAGGGKIAFSEAIKPGRVTMISFWATWCVPCKKEIKNIRLKLPEWRKETDFDYVTVSIDESRAEGLVRSYAVSQGWDFPYFMDPNSDLKRSLNFQTVPFTLVVGKDGKIGYMHSGYEEGGENEVYKKVQELAKM